MKRALLKLVSVFQIVSGVVGIYVFVVSVLGFMSSDYAPMLWYGVFPLLSVTAGLLL